MADHQSFGDMIDQLRAGNEDAATLLFQQYAHRLIGLARLHLNDRLRQKVDPEDVVQSALKSFFHGQVQAASECPGQLSFRLSAPTHANCLPALPAGTVILRQAVVVIGKTTHLCTFLSAVSLGDLLYDATSLSAGYDLAMPALGTQTA